MKDVFYNRILAVEYAKTYAEKRNPNFYNFDKIGGNCTNFASQCLYAGLPIMNYSPTGWYYNSVNDRSPAWTDVRLFYDFIVNNEGVGPYGTLCEINEVEIGDFIQLKNHTKWFHSLVVCAIMPEDILICSNSFNSLLRPLSSYYFQQLRCIKILGGRKN